jgi:predicted transposase/invertase (TIGR01784 family)
VTLLQKKWIYFIKNADKLEMIPEEFSSIDEFKTAFDTAKMYEWKEKELEVYDYVSMQKGKRLSELDTARNEGIEQGKLQEKLDIDKNLLLAGVENDKISIATRLSTEEIEKLQK